MNTSRLNSSRISRIDKKTNNLQNVSIAVVGQGTEFTIYEDAQVDPYLELISGEERRGGGQQPAEGEEGAMETD